MHNLEKRLAVSTQLQPILARRNADPVLSCLLIFQEKLEIQIFMWEFLSCIFGSYSNKAKNNFVSWSVTSSSREGVRKEEVVIEKCSVSGKTFWREWDLSWPTVGKKWEISKDGERRDGRKTLKGVRREIPLEKSPQVIGGESLVKVGDSKIMEGLECWEHVWIICHRR